MIDRRRARVLVLSSLVALAGCEVIEEKIREGQKPPTSGGGPGGTPGTPLPPGAPAPQTPVKPVDPAGAACMVDSDCQLVADYCTGCDCRLLGRGDKAPACSGPGVRCLVDPCGDLVAFCSGGRCAVKSTRPVPPPPPAPPTTCTGWGEGSPTTCRTTSDWKLLAHRDCEARGLQLQNYWPAESCGTDSYRYNKWECCGAVPPPPVSPPPPTTPPDACFGGSDGGPTSCKSPDVWKTYASDLCAQKGAVLRDFGVDVECGGGNYRYMKFGCCSAAVPPKPTPEPPQKCSADSECPAIRIACKQCPEGGQTCPSSRCRAGTCQITWSTCAGTPTPPAMPWDPCAGKKCGDTCTLCPPWSSSCAETKDIKTCDIGGKCLSGPPSACR